MSASPPALQTYTTEKQPVTNGTLSAQPSVSDIEKDGKEREGLYEQAAEAEAGEDNDLASSSNNDAAKPPAASAGPPGGMMMSPPPDGGLTAWLQVLGGWMLFFNTWGILNTFGVYQTYYESGELFQSTSSNISWIGSIQAFCVLLVGLFTGPVFDRGYLRPLLIVGSFGVVFGHMMLSLCTEYWQVVLAQGLTVGLGAGCLFVPAVAIFPTYFKAKLGMVIGLAASGSSTGGIIYPIMFYRLVAEVGFGWATRILGFTALATLIIPIVVMKQRFKPAKARSLFDFSALTDGAFMTLVAGCFLGFTGMYAVFFYISYFAESTGITDPSLAFYLIPILNAGSVFGRTVPNYVSDKIGPFNIIFPGAIICGVVVLCLLAVTNVGGVVVIALFFGFFSGIFIALPPVLFVALTPDKSKVGTRIGMGFAMLGFATFTGGPGTGGIVGSDPRNLHWDGAWIYGGVCLLAGGAIFFVLRMQRAGWKLMVKL